MSPSEKSSPPSTRLLSKNRRWTEALEQSLASLSPREQAGLLRAPGQACAQEVWALCETWLGRHLTNLDDLMEGWNLLRDHLGLHGHWQAEPGGYRGVFGECGCPLVRSGLATLTPVRCHCTQAMMEAIFARTAGRPIKVELLRTIGRGDEACEFKISV